MKPKSLFFLGVLFFLPLQSGLGQSNDYYFKQWQTGVPSLDIGSDVSDSLSKHIEATFLPFGATLSDAQSGVFSPLQALNNAQSSASICWLRFAVINRGEKPITKWLVLNQPGLEYFRLYRVQQKSVNSCEGGAGGDRKQLCTSTGHQHSIQFDLAHNDTLICYLLLFKRVYSFNRDGFYLFNAKDYYHYNLALDQKLNKEKGFLSITCSLMFFTSLFFAFQFFFGGNKIYIWYAIYLLAIGLFFLKHLETLSAVPILFGHFSWTLIATEMPWTGLITATYIQFILAFFKLRENQPTHYQWFKMYLWVSVVQISLSILFDLLFFNKNYSAPLFEISQVLTAIFQIYGITVLAKTPGLPYRLVLLGSIILTLTTGLTMFLPYEMRKALLGSPLGLIQIGTIVEVLLFSSALGFRMRQIEKDRRANERIRENISSDLHDEIGSTLSSIAILSEALQRKTARGDNHQSIGVITERTRQVMDTMSDIVWSVNPLNDKMNTVLLKMREFAVETLEAKEILLHFHTDEVLPTFRLAIEQRKDFYLFFKETINNVAKYSKAKNVWVELTNKDNKLSLSITDDGIGFDPMEVKKGNGLKNMQARAQQLGGQCFVRSGVGEGTTVLLTFSIV